MVYISLAPELKELKDFELLDEQEQIAKKEDVSKKIMNKFKMNEKRFIEITKSMHIININSKITKVLDKLFNSQDDPYIKCQYIDGLVIIGSVFLNYHDKNICKGVDLISEKVLDEFLIK